MICCARNGWMSESGRIFIRNRKILLGSVAALAFGMALSNAPAWAGNGGKGTGPNGTAGGVDGTLSEATGTDSVTPGSGGGGGATDLTTGNGAPGGSGGSAGAGAAHGAAGATGATGLTVTTVSSISTAISGGQGGVGAPQVTGISMQGGSGGGGVGVSATADITVTHTGSVTGGGSATGGVAGGGGGGAGVFSSANVTIESGGAVTGGAASIRAGGGAAAIILTKSTTVRNAGAVTGGAGATGITTASGGDGGAGVQLLSGGTVTNDIGATITGGAGGSGRSSNVTYTTSPGAGGAGIKGANLSVINGGTITGGLGGAASAGGGPAGANGAAILFTGGVNSLEIWATSNITGNVQAFSTADTFKLGGSADASFDLSQIGASGKYQGFGHFEKTGTGVWTLTGTSTEVMPWTLTQGTLKINSDAQLGDPSGSLTFNGGTLETSTSFATSRAIALKGDGGFLTDAGTTLTVSSALSGTGALTKSGTGTLVLTAGNTFTGRTTIAAGTLVLTGSGNLAGDVTDNGALVVNRTDAVTLGGAISGSGSFSHTGSGTVILTGNNSYAGGTTIASGTLQLGTGGTTGGITGDVANNGILIFNRSDTASFAGVISGTGKLSQSGAGTTVLTAANSYSGGTMINNGTLAVDGAITGATDIAAAGRLEGNGRVGSVANAGVVAPGHGGFGTLTLTGNYASNDGRLEIEAALGGDNSATDRLVVNGGTSGTTQVVVINRGGLGGQTAEGIKVVDVAGVSNGVFTLKGDYVLDGQPAVVGGAFGYRLYKNGVADPADGDWYLRSSLLNPDPAAPSTPAAPSQPLYQPGVPVYESYVQTLFALNGVPTLQQRLGNQVWGGAAEKAGAGGWVRVETASYRPQVAVSTTGADKDIDTWQVQMGGTKTLREGEDGARLAGGITAHYGEAETSVTSIFGNGGIKTTGFGLGGTLTWYGAKGIYADGQAQLNWFDSTLKSALLGTLAEGDHGQGETLSLEVGQRAPISDALTLTPQVQMIYSHVDFGHFTDPVSAVVSADNGASLKMRWGLSLDRQASWTGARGGAHRSHIYGLVNLTYEALGGAQVQVSGTPITSRDKRLLGEIGVGGSYYRDDRLALYSEVTADTSIADFGDTYGVKGTAGLRLRF